jgi:hypothetical protein
LGGTGGGIGVVRNDVVQVVGIVGVVGLVGGGFGARGAFEGGLLRGFFGGQGCEVERAFRAIGDDKVYRRGWGRDDDVQALQAGNLALCGEGDGEGAGANGGHAGGSGEVTGLFGALGRRGGAVVIAPSGGCDGEVALEGEGKQLGTSGLAFFGERFAGAVEPVAEGALRDAERGGDGGGAQALAAERPGALGGREGGR